MSLIKDDPEGVHEYPVLRGHVEGIHQRFKRFKLRGPEARVPDVQPVIGSTSGAERLHTSTLHQEQQVQASLSAALNSSSLNVDAAHVHAPAGWTAAGAIAWQSECFLGCERLQSDTTTVPRHDSVSYGMPLRDAVMSSTDRAQDASVHQQVQLEASRQGSFQHHSDLHYCPGVPAPPKFALAVPDVAITSCATRAPKQNMPANASCGPKQSQKPNRRPVSASATSQLNVHQQVGRNMYALPSGMLRHPQCRHADAFSKNQRVFGGSCVSNSIDSDAAPIHRSKRQDLKGRSCNSQSRQHSSAGAGHPCCAHEVMYQLSGRAAPPVHRALNTASPSQRIQRQGGESCIAAWAPLQTAGCGGQTSIGLHQRAEVTGATSFRPIPDASRPSQAYVSCQRVTTPTKVCATSADSLHQGCQTGRAGDVGVQESRKYASHRQAVPSSFATAIRMNGGAIVAPVSAAPVSDPKSFAVQINAQVAANGRLPQRSPYVLDRGRASPSIPTHIVASQASLNKSHAADRYFQQLLQQATGAESQGKFDSPSKQADLMRFNGARAPCKQAAQGIHGDVATGVVPLASICQQKSPLTIADRASIDSQLRALVAKAQTASCGAVQRCSAQATGPSMCADAISTPSYIGLSGEATRHDYTLRAFKAIQARLLQTYHNGSHPSFNSHPGSAAAATCSLVADPAHLVVSNRPGSSTSNVHGVSAADTTTQLAADVFEQMQSLHMHTDCAGSVGAAVSRAAGHSTYMAQSQARRAVEEAVARTQQHVRINAGRWCPESMKVATNRGNPHDVPAPGRPARPAIITTGAVSRALTCVTESACVHQNVITSPALNVRDKPVTSSPENMLQGDGEAVSQLPNASAPILGAPADVSDPILPEAQGPNQTSVKKHDRVRCRIAQGGQAKALQCQEDLVDMVCSSAASQPVAEKTCCAVTQPQPVYKGPSENSHQLAHSNTARHATADTVRVAREIKARGKGNDPAGACMPQSSAAGEDLCGQGVALESAVAQTDAFARVEAKQQPSPDPANNAATTHNTTSFMAARDAPLHGNHFLHLDAAEADEEHAGIPALEDGAKEGHGEFSTQVTRGHHAVLDPIPADSLEEGAAHVQAEIAVELSKQEADAPLHSSTPVGAHADIADNGAVCFKRYRLQQVIGLPAKKWRRTSRRGAATADGVEGQPKMGAFAQRIACAHAASSSASAHATLRRGSRKSQRAHPCKQADHRLAVELEAAQMLEAAGAHTSGMAAEQGAADRGCPRPGSP